MHLRILRNYSEKDLRVGVRTESRDSFNFHGIGFVFVLLVVGAVGLLVLLLGWFSLLLVRCTRTSSMAATIVTMSAAQEQKNNTFYVVNLSKRNKWCPGKPSRTVFTHFLTFFMTHFAVEH